MKQLSQSDLHNQISLPSLNIEEQKLLSVVNRILEVVGQKISGLETKIIKNELNITSLIMDVEAIKNSDAVFDFKLNTPSVEPPPPLKNGTLRKIKVDEIISEFQNNSWIGFQGINGTGKTQLAILVSQRFNNCYWIDLRTHTSNSEKMTLLFEVFLSKISNCNIIHDRKEWMNNLVRSIPNDSIIILNDIPQVQLDYSFGRLLALFTNAIEKYDIKLLTTSNQKISTSVKQAIGEDIFMEYYDFVFTDNEIIEYLLNNGATKRIADYITLIIVISQRNPRLLSAIIYHLKKINWGRDSEDFFNVFFNKEFSSEILDDVQASIKCYISDEKSRELLYRLSLINGKFNSKEVNAISSVNERITNPNEKINDLINTWIEKRNNDSYYASPLVLNLGEKNLTEDTIRDTHIALAQNILSSKSIDQTNAST